MLAIQIEQIPNNEQRYPTVGDWYFTQVTPAGEANLPPNAPLKTLISSPDTLVILHIKVSALPDWKHTMLIAVHELVEVLLCINDGVTQDMVDRFDIQYEELRKAGDESEPGDAVLAPYRNQHCYATAVERMLCAAFGLPWAEYEIEIGSLYEAEVASGRNKEAPETCNSCDSDPGYPMPAVDLEPPKAA